MQRRNVVEGTFYTSDKDKLERQIYYFLENSENKIDTMGCLIPHAGYMYSGYVAGRVLSSIEPKSTYVILGTDHTGMGQPCGLDFDRQWSTPFGLFSVDKDLSSIILESSEYIVNDTLCHDYEHSIEVQLPFLKILSPEARIVPITIGQKGIKEYLSMGRDLAEAVIKYDKPVTIIASSDMTHYEPHDTAKRKDYLAIESMTRLDPESLYRTVIENDISMCGLAPASVMLSAVKNMGARKGVLTDYQTSGDVSGDRSSVVGYAGIIFY